jgi:thiol-disulfide isomerase/thioredoxin
MLKHTFVAIALLTGVCLGQAPTPTSTPSSEGLALLQQASRRYAEAKSYRIEEVEESNSRSELSRQWHKTLTTAIQDSGSRYHYESRSANGSRVRVSDGKTEWVYDVENNAYTQKPALAEGPAAPKVLMPADMGEFEARKLRQGLANLAGAYQAAERLPDETLTLAGQPVPCYVVKVSSQQLKKPMRPGAWSEKTVWIEKDNNTIRQVVTRQHTASLLAPAIFEDGDITATYPVVELDAPIPDTVFSFAPPQTAKLVDQLPSPFTPAGEDLTGKTAPEVTLKSADGREVSLASLRGKPVLIDFWATWCLPCVVSLPQMAGIYQQTKGRGLEFFSVDEDQDAKTAADFLAKKNIPWPNVHDGGEIGKAFNKTGLPLTVLVDAQGKVVYYQTGYANDNLSDLRAAIAKLGPEYAGLAPAK